MEKISVIVPVYNVEKYIERCLKSILDQTYPEFEIICVDDCGTDRSMEIVRTMQEQFPDRIRIVYNEKNLGLGALRDAGIQAAQGEYLAFIDSDDYIREDYLERYRNACAENQADIAAGSFTRDVEGTLTEIPVNMQDEMFAWTNVSACTKLFRTGFLREHDLSFKGVRRYEDEGFMYRTLVCRPKVVMIPYTGYYYFMNSESITKNQKKSRADIFREYTVTVENLINALKCRPQEQQILNYCLASSLTANLLYNGRGAGGKKMSELYREYDRLMKRIDQKICKNPYIALKYLKAEPAKKRYAAWLVLRARKFRLDRLLFLLDSVI